MKASVADTMAYDSWPESYKEIVRRLVSVDYFPRGEQNKGEVEEAFEDGYKEGYEIGYLEGNRDGQDKGYGQGYTAGLEAGAA